MTFHAKALELYTLAYNSIQNVDEEEDLEVGNQPANNIGASVFINVDWSLALRKRMWVYKGLKRISFYVHPLLCTWLTWWLFNYLCVLHWLLIHSLLIDHTL